MSTKELIDSIVKRPGMYFGSTESFLQSFYAFYVGYSIGQKHNHSNSEGVDIEKSFFPKEFSKKMGDCWNGDMHWLLDLEKSHPDSESAWNTFSEKWKEYRGENFCKKQSSS